MARHRTAATATGRVCEVCYGAGGGEGDECIWLRRKEMEGLCYRRCCGDAAYAVHRDAEGNGFGTRISCFLPDVLSRRNARSNTVYGIRYGGVFRGGNKIPRRYAAIDIHIGGSLRGAAAHTDILCGYGVHLLQQDNEGEEDEKNFVGNVRWYYSRSTRVEVYHRLRRGNTADGDDCGVPCVSGV